MTFALRPYQQQLVDAVRATWASGAARVLACLPTGGGKSECAIDLILGMATPSTRALVIVERKVLAGQWLERILRHAPHATVGVLQAENTSRAWAPILIATAQTIKARGVPEGIGLTVIDESHIWHKSHDDVLQAVAGGKVLGLTATPMRAGLGLRFDKLIVGTTIGALIDQGHLVQPRYFAPRHDAIETALQSVSVRAGDYASNELSAKMRGKSIIGDVVGAWQQRGENRQTIAFCVDKAHAHDLADEFVAASITACSIVDDTPDDDRARLFRQFDRGEVRVLCSVGVLAVGFDSPIASCAILARPTLSTSLHIQQGGRVLRPHPGKADCLILDHAGNVMQHGRLEDFEPPTDLSQIDKKTDKRSRKQKADAWICKNCEAVNPMQEDICTECGNPRRRTSAVYIVDGELVPLYSDDPRTKDAPTHTAIRDFYLQLVFFGTSKGFKNPHGWAFHRTAEKFSIDDPKRVIAWIWRDLAPMRPTEETARWLRADWQRQRIVQQYEAATT